MSKLGWLMAGALVALSAGPPPAAARIPEPDHLFYGQVTSYGSPMANASLTVQIGAATTAIASFTLTPAAGGAYVLRVPMDSVDPQEPGTARGGEDARLYVNGQLAGRSVVGARGAATRVDLDPAFDDLLSVQDVTVTEGNSGTVTATFTVSLSEASPVTVSVNVGTTTAGATATAGADFTVVNTAVSLPPGTLSGTVDVTVKGDLLNEADETFFVDLTSPSGANLGRARAFGVIANDDPLPVLAASRPITPEGNPGGPGGSLVYTATLSAPSGQVVSAAYAARGATATAGADFTPVSGQLTFPPGVTTRQVTVAVLPDALYERDETVVLDLSAPVNVAFAAPGLPGTIRDDDHRGSDFDGDGRSDLLVQAPDGRVDLWLLDGANVKAALAVTGEDPGGPATVVATPDVDGDAGADVLVIDAADALQAWILEGRSRSDILAIVPETMGPGWAPRASVDYDGDLRDDIVWQHGTGPIRVWRMDGTIRLSEVAIATSPGGEWKVVAAADVDGDGHPDFVLQNATGLLRVWYMDGANVRTAGAFSPLRPSDMRFRVAGAGDFNGDGKVDLVFQHQLTDAVMFWYLDGATRVGQASLGTALVPTAERGMRVAGPR